MPQGDIPKPISEAYTNLVKIVESKRLWVSRYQELINVDVGAVFKGIMAGGVTFHITVAR